MKAIDLENRYSAHNYEPLPVVLARGKGAHLWDTSGRRYVDMMSAYSAASHGHAHPRILDALAAQAGRLAVPSRAYFNDRLGPFLAELCKLTGLDAALPMNTGAEAVETAIKAARRWGYRVKGIARDRAEIIVATGNFHGRTTTVISFSTEPDYRDGFGPFTPGFRAVPFGDLAAIERAITPETAAVLIEPIQGEAGIIVPPAGYLAGLRRICDAHRVLLILDEVQSGLGRTGAWFAFQHEGIRPDGVDPGQGARRRRAAGLGLRRHPRGHGRVHARLPWLDLRRQSARRRGRARGAACHPRGRAGGAQPRSRRPHARAAVARSTVPRSSTCAAAACGSAPRSIPRSRARAPPASGCWTKGVLSKETHHTVVRLAPPLVIARDDLDWALDRFEDVLRELDGVSRRADAALALA